MLSKTNLSENGRRVEPAISPPELLRKFAGRDLPFNELDEIILAFTVCQELEHDAIYEPSAGFHQLLTAVALRMYYHERLLNLARRIRRGDPATMQHLLRNPEPEHVAQGELIGAPPGAPEDAGASVRSDTHHAA